MRADQIKDLMAIEGMTMDMLRQVIEISTRPSRDAIRMRTRRAQVPHKPRTCSDEHKEEKKENKRPAAKARRHPMATDWLPSQHGYDHLIAKGFERDLITHQAERMRNWALAKGETSTNWDLNLYNWMEKQKEWGVNGHASKPNGQTYRPGERFVTSSGKVF